MLYKHKQGRQREKKSLVYDMCDAIHVCSMLWLKDEMRCNKSSETYSFSPRPVLKVGMKSVAAVTEVKCRYADNRNDRQTTTTIICFSNTIIFMKRVEDEGASSQTRIQI